MSFPRYPEYKASGVEWLGDVPGHWDIIQGRRLFAQKREPSFPTDEQLSATQKHGVLPQSLFMEKEDQKVTLALSGLENFKHVQKNDFVISLRSFQGGIEHSPFTGCVSPAYTILRPSFQVVPMFWKYLLKSKGYIESLQSVTDGIRDGKNISYEQFGRVIVPCVSSIEQQAIADFLDLETAKIDGLIEEQRRLVELLKEKRQAVISHAVTKGLNPNAPMKPSGIEWLGDIPEHWEVGPIKRFFVSLDGKRIPLSAEERSTRSGAYPYYGASGIIDWVDNYLFDEDLVLVSEDGANLINRSTPISFVATGEYWVNNHAHILKPIDNNIQYWAERIEAIDLLPFVTGSAQPKLTADALMNLQIAVPSSVKERYEIQTYFLKEIESLDRLFIEAEKSITLLQERRTALISAAVTGKIDVRGLANAESTV